jgi:hypothetical protein
LWWVSRVGRISFPTGAPNNDADGHAPQVPAIGKNQNSTAVQPGKSSLSQFETKQITLARVLFHAFRLHGRESRGAK